MRWFKRKRGRKRKEGDRNNIQFPDAIRNENKLLNVCCVEFLNIVGRIHVVAYNERHGKIGIFTD